MHLQAPGRTLDHALQTRVQYVGHPTLRASSGG
jgi:hypothetical protein